MVENVKDMTHRKCIISICLLFVVWLDILLHSLAIFSHDLDVVWVCTMYICRYILNTHTYIRTTTKIKFFGRIMLFWCLEPNDLWKIVHTECCSISICSIRWKWLFYHPTIHCYAIIFTWIKSTCINVIEAVVIDTALSWKQMHDHADWANQKKRRREIVTFRIHLNAIILNNWKWIKKKTKKKTFQLDRTTTKVLNFRVKLPDERIIMRWKISLAETTEK